MEDWGLKKVAQRSTRWQPSGQAPRKRPPRSPGQIEFSSYEILDQSSSDVMHKEGLFAAQMGKDLRLKSNTTALRERRHPSSHYMIPLKKCMNCWRETRIRCSICRTVYYCSVECQRRDFPLHQILCTLQPMTNESETRDLECYPRFGDIWRERGRRAAFSLVLFHGADPLKLRYDGYVMDFVSRSSKPNLDRQY